MMKQIMPETQELPLRDIHLPEAVSWWPLAPGWWGLLGLAVLAVAIYYLVRLVQKRRRLRNTAMLELKLIHDAFAKHHDALQLVRDVSVLLRRIAISYYPRVDVASLTAEDWLKFLDECFETSQGSHDFSRGPGKILITAPYQQQVDIDAQALMDLCNKWVEALPLKPLAARTI